VICRKVEPRKEDLQVILQSSILDHVFDTARRDALMIASAEGNLTIFRALLDATPETELGEKPSSLLFDTSRSDMYGRTAFHLAAEHGKAQIVAEFLNRDKINPDKVSDDGCTALDLAILNGHADVVAELVKSKRVDVNRCEGLGVKPLTFAASKGDAEIVNALLNSDQVSVNFKVSCNASALHVAAMRGHADVIAKFRGHKKVNINQPSLPEGNTPLHLAALNGHEQVITQLLESKKIDFSIYNQSNASPWDLAIRNGHGGAIMQLSPKMRSYYRRILYPMLPALNAAGHQDHVQTITRLLPRPGVNINYNSDNLGDIPLDLAIEVGNAEVVDKLLENSQDYINQTSINGYPVLHWAVLCRQTKIFDQLWDSGKIDVNESNIYGHTLLHLAVKNGQLEMVTRILKSNLDMINELDPEGNTALHLAAKHGHVEVLEELYC